MTVIKLQPVAIGISASGQPMRMPGARQCGGFLAHFHARATQRGNCRGKRARIGEFQPRGHHAIGIALLHQQPKRPVVNPKSQGLVG